MKMQKFSHYTYDSYMRKSKDMVKYFDKPLEEVRKYLLEYLTKEKNYQTEV